MSCPTLRRTVQLLALVTVLSAYPLFSQAQTKIYSHAPADVHRIWFTARYFEYDPTMYANATEVLRASSQDPLMFYDAGIATLSWTYGINVPLNITPPPDDGQYWINAIDEPYRTVSTSDPNVVYINAGNLLDEWRGEQSPDVEQWAIDGLRQARANHPDAYIQVWTTAMRPTLLQLAAEGTVDLIVAENFTFVPAYQDSGLNTIGFQGGINRMQAAKDYGVLDKVVWGFGQITDKADTSGYQLNLTDLEAQMAQVRNRFPQSPGVAFFQGYHTGDPNDPDPNGQAGPLQGTDLIRGIDRLSAKYWPDQEIAADRDVTVIEKVSLTDGSISYQTQNVNQLRIYSDYEYLGYRRTSKAYLGFDLTQTLDDLANLTSASLVLDRATNPGGNLEPAQGWENWAIRVYGVTDDTCDLDGWTESTITWLNAPANAPGNVLSYDATFLGEFIPDTEDFDGWDTFVLEGQNLIDFLQQHGQDGRVTFILVADSDVAGTIWYYAHESADGDLIAAPRLRLNFSAPTQLSTPEPASLALLFAILIPLTHRQRK